MIHITFDGHHLLDGFKGYYVRFARLVLRPYVTSFLRNEQSYYAQQASPSTAPVRHVVPTGAVKNSSLSKGRV